MIAIDERNLVYIAGATVVGFFVLWIIIRIIKFAAKIGSLETRAVFISGCDTGFGHDLAIKCAKNGMPVFAGCLTEQGASTLREKTKLLPGSVDTIVLDVTCDESVRKLAEWLEKRTEPYGGLHAVVNNAGIVGNSFYDEILSINDYRSTLEVNTFGVIRVTHALRHLVKKTKGRIITAASICGRLAIPGIGPYTVSKFAVEGYCDIIRRELRMWGVSVHILEPGFFKTPLLDKSKIESHIAKVWENAPTHIKEEYGEEFFKKGQEKSTALLRMVASNDLMWPVNAYFHAITARFPKTRYQIGYDCMFMFIPISLLPSNLQDVCVTIGQRILGAPRPQKQKCSSREELV